MGFAKPLVIPITKATKFFPAEDYHQDFYKKDPGRYYSYRKGSGRDRFIDKVWGEDREYTPEAPAKAAWQSFLKP